MICFKYLINNLNILIEIHIFNNIGGNNGVTEFTRNELRAFVGVRSQQQGVTRLSNQLLPGQNVNSAELDSLGLNFDMSPTGIEEIKYL